MRVSPSLATFTYLGLIVAGAACGSSSTKATSGGAGGGTSSSTTSTSSSSSSGSTGGASTSSTSSTSTTGASSSGSCDVADAGIGGGFPFPVVSYSGAPLIDQPKVISISFKGDNLAPQLDQFGDALTGTAYWNTVRAGFSGAGGTCIGDGPPGTSIVLPTAAAASYTDSSMPGGASSLKTWLTGLITAKTVPAPDDNTIYAIYFPTATTVTLDGSASCQAFDGYHDGMLMGTQQVVYAVINECTQQGITTLQNTTITTSHEVIEAATDGIQTQTTGGYYLDFNDENVLGWNDIQGGEVGDLCVDPFGLALDETTENGFTAQRIWSVPQAAAGKNPCVPVPAGEVYFNAWPSATVLVMDVGQSQTITINALSDAAMPAWTVLAQDWTDPNTTYLTFSIVGGQTDDAGTAQLSMASGATAQLTVTLIADPGNSANGEADGVLVSANNADPNKVTAAHFWPFIALTTAEAAQQQLTMMKKQHGARTHKVSHARGRHPLSSLHF